MKRVHDDDFRGDAELLHPREYLKCADIEALPNGEIALTIERVERGRELRMSDGKVDYKPVVHFRGTDKKLVLNITNKDRIKEWYGRKVADWVGKKITLYPARGPSKTENLKRAGQDGVRVRAKGAGGDDR